MIDKMNLTKLNPPSLKNGLPRAKEFKADWVKERDPPRKSRTMFAMEKPWQL